MEQQETSKIKIQGKEELAKGIYYEVDTSEEPLGEGGAGIVRRGVQVDEKTGTKQEVAIKFLFEDLAPSAITRSRYEAGIHIVHENLVEMKAFVVTGEEQGIYGHSNAHYHVVSELLHGIMLLDIMNGQVTEKEIARNPKIKEFYDLLMYDRNTFAVRIVRGLLSGIMALHDNDYIHRDIDPSNIMITTDGKIKLIDLGIARKMHDNANTPRLTNMGQFVGKAHYASPELVDGDLYSQNETTDIYAIGIVLYQLLTGFLPFDGPMYEVLQLQKTQPIPLNRIVNKKLRAIVKKATEKKQADRYQTAALFRAELDMFEKETGKKPASNPGLKPAQKKTGENAKTSPWLWISAILTGLLTGAVLGWII